MIEEQELIKKLNQENIECFKTLLIPDLNSNVSIFLENNSIDELIKFVKINDIKSIFYTYLHHDEDEYLIDLDLENDSMKKVYDHFKKEIDEHNKTVKDLDYSKPYLCALFCLYNSREIIIVINDDWTENLGILSCDDKMQKLVELDKDFLTKLEKEKWNKQMQIKEDLKTFIINDIQFQNCTNHKLRRLYLYEFFKREDVPTIYKDEYQQENGFPDAKMYTFIEMFWKEYKNSINN